MLLLLWGAGEQGAGVGPRVGMATRAVEPLVMSPWLLSLWYFTTGLVSALDSALVSISTATAASAAPVAAVAAIGAAPAIGVDRARAAVLANAVIRKGTRVQAARGRWTRTRRWRWTQTRRWWFRYFFFFYALVPIARSAVFAICSCFASAAIRPTLIVAHFIQSPRASIIFETHTIFILAVCCLPDASTTMLVQFNRIEGHHANEE